MILRFSINFNTRWGEELFITGSSYLLGNNKTSGAFKLNYTGNSVWEGEITVDPLKERIISYKYFVKDTEGSIYFEAGKGRFLALNPATKEVTAYDQWQGNDNEAPFLTAPFADVFFAGDNAAYTHLHRHNSELIIKVTIPNVPLTKEVLICGNTKNTGEWDVSKGTVMNRTDGVKWTADFNIDKKENKELLYKFIIKDKVTGEYTWEEGEDRRLTLPRILKNNTVIIEHSAANFPRSYPGFGGVAIPLFSLRSKNSYGTGDISDLKLLIDWAKVCGLSVIQLLPINDTSGTMTWRDSYPYNCISAFALHPIYINPENVGRISDTALAKELRRDGRLLNHNAFLDYQEALDVKMRYLKAVYKETKDDTRAEPGYYAFVKQNKEWLFPYAVFCTLRDKYKTADFRQWEEYAIFSEKTVAVLSSRGSRLYNDIYFHIFIQYHLHKQMCAIKDYARANGVAIKGDIPIGISRNGADAWQYPELFNFGQQAGAPPDSFSSRGQNWGFPTYNWDEMEKDHYSWWKNRLSHFSNYFDAYRIDHILGFFRIWEIPAGSSGAKEGHFSPSLPLTKAEISEWGIEKIQEGLFIKDPYRKGKYHPAICGKESREYNALSKGQQQRYDSLFCYYFYQRHNDLWYKGAMKKLQQLIAAGNMLACGEDLGMLNQSVSRCMENLNILSLELQQMPKKPGVKLADPQEYPYLSVCTTSTHDCEPLRVWLGKELVQYGGMIGENGERYFDATPGSCLETIKKNLSSSSMLAIFPLQDWFAIDGKLRSKYAYAERINDPSDPQHYWKYRMHLNLEELINTDKFNLTIKKSLAETNRL